MSDSVAPFLVKGQFQIRRLLEANKLAEFLSELCPNKRLSMVGISEILVNAIEHGNLGLSYEEKSILQQQNNWLEEIDRRLNLPEHIDQYVNVEVTKTSTEICIKVTDQGQGFDWKKYTHKEPEKSLATHGRGIILAKQLAFKSLTYSGKGNIVTCVIALTRDLPH